MAIKATVFKASLQIADMDRHYYAEHALTISRHPSETDERMMVRLLTFALHANEHLAFGEGMTNDDDADLWLKDLTGAIKLWIDVGLPDEKLIRKACGRSDHVMVYCYGGNAAKLWYEQNAKQFLRLKNLTVISLSQNCTHVLANLAERTMQLQCNIQDGQAWLMNDQDSVVIESEILKAATSKK